MDELEVIGRSLNFPEDNIQMDSVSNFDEIRTEGGEDVTEDYLSKQPEKEEFTKLEPK